jgi:F0F1-type ATP synthase membrane subunit c/vacuolar-type H+-ATPase subunit K
MRAQRAYLAGCGLAVALASLAAGLHVPMVGASPQQASAQQSSPQLSMTNVNRTLMGDRLPLVAPVGNAKTVPSSSPRLPEGCEAAVSAMTRSSLARTPARCLS